MYLLLSIVASFAVPQSHQLHIPAQLGYYGHHQVLQSSAHVREGRGNHGDPVTMHVAEVLLFKG